MKKRYEWRELTEDGLLREPKECGPSYERSSVNNYGGFQTEEEAFKAFEQFKKVHQWVVPRELVLVTFYECDDDA